MKAYVSPNVRVAVGYGACIDIFVNAADLLGNEPPPKTPSHASQINTKKDLLETFAYFFSHGAAAE
jgi:ADP-dependent glucokinase